MASPDTVTGLRAPDGARGARALGAAGAAALAPGRVGSAGRRGRGQRVHLGRDRCQNLADPVHQRVHVRSGRCRLTLGLRLWGSGSLLRARTRRRRRLRTRRLIGRGCHRRRRRLCLRLRRRLGRRRCQRHVTHRRTGHIRRRARLHLRARRGGGRGGRRRGGAIDRSVDRLAVGDGKHADAANDRQRSEEDDDPDQPRPLLLAKGIGTGALVAEGPRRAGDTDLGDHRRVVTINEWNAVGAEKRRDIIGAQRSHSRSAFVWHHARISNDGFAVVQITGEIAFVAHRDNLLLGYAPS